MAISITVHPTLHMSAELRHLILKLMSYQDQRIQNEGMYVMLFYFIGKRYINTSGEHGNAVQIETKNKRFPEDLV